MYRLRSLLAAAALFVVAALAAGTALAQQTYPNRTVRFIVPWPPGGGVDLLARALAAELSTRWVNR